MLCYYYSMKNNNNDLQALLEECVHLERNIIERERGAAFDQYCNHMDVCCSSAISDNNVPQHHLQFWTNVVTSYKLKTKGLPRTLVNSHYNILKKVRCSTILINNTI
jgi:hypothetical protein